MKNFARMILLAISIAALSPLAATADSRHDKHYDDKDPGDHHDKYKPLKAIKLLKDSLLKTGEHHPKHKPLKVALWGDEFYSDDEAVKLIQIEQTINSMNKHNLDFTLFAGDTKNGSSLCTNQAIGQDVSDIFNSLNAPTLYSLGDNEWTDCHRVSNGSYDPLERLSYLRSLFFSENLSQGRHPMVVERQGEPGQAYSENSRFTKSNVEFVALHVPGSNNNLVATAKQCTNKSNRTQADCDAATAEFQARNQKNIEWLQASFDKAQENGNAGIVILIQADIYFPFELSDGGYQDDFLPQMDANNGYTDFFNTLVSETHNFDGQVLLVHGDSHYYKIDKAMFNEDGTLTSNFNRVQVFGSLENSWIEMTVDPSSENVFSFSPVVLSH
jgi:hypothetical protein